jgi:hypothetical protein
MRTFIRYIWTRKKPGVATFRDNGIKVLRFVLQKLPEI